MGKWIFEKFPALARRALKENSKKAAIQLFCIECMGGYRAEVKNCSSVDCPLYYYRNGGVPVPRAKRELSDEQREAARERMRKMREAKNEN